MHITVSSADDLPDGLPLNAQRHGGHAPLVNAGGAHDEDGAMKHANDIQAVLAGGDGLTDTAAIGHG